MPLLGTKLHVPRQRRQLVGRPRLTRLLQASPGAMPRLVLVAAPAGFGKTTLMTQWLSSASDTAAESGGPLTVAWLSLDEDDSEPGQFLTHVIAALQAAAIGAAAPSTGRASVTDAEFGAEALALLQTGRGQSTKDAWVSLVNDLDVFLGPTVLVLDDYHVVSDASVHEAVGFLLDHLPDHVTVALTTRADPPLPLARLRARGELVEVRAADLRFTPAEAAEFLNDCMGLGLDPEHVEALETRTEGWAAGLQLAALSARGLALHADPSAAASFVDDFSGSHRYVLDYLVEEVLNVQPDDVRAFLLDTSVLDELTGPLCDALTGDDDGAPRLKALERANVFVVPLDDHRQWYRYHHLFADALRARLLASGPEVTGRLLAAASGWYAAQGSLPDAVRYALAGHDASRAADLVELALPGLRQHREDRTLRTWVCALPDDEVRRRPLLMALRGWSRLSEADLGGAASWLDDAEAGLVSQPRGGLQVPAALQEASDARDREMRALPATIAAFRAAIAQADGDIEGTRQQASRAVELAGPQDHLARASGAGFLGLAAWADGDIPAAIDTFTQAVDELRAAGNDADVLGTTVVLAELWMARARPDHAERLYEQALRTSDRTAGGTMTTVGELHVGLADALREQGDLDGAAAHLQLARELGDAHTLLENRYRWYSVSAALLVARGDLGGASTMLDEAETLYLPGFFPRVRPIPAARARVWIRQGRLDEARDWARGRSLADDDRVGYLDEYEQLTLARLVVAEHTTAGDQHSSGGTLDEVLELTRRIETTAAALSRTGSVVDAGLVRALAHHARRDLDAATSDLESAMLQAAPGGGIRPFLDEGPPVLDLLARLAGRPAHADQATALLTAVNVPTGVPRAPTRTEPLSERELEVLQLLATDLTGPDIARHLYVSVNTLRTHTKHIFSKLDVTTRRAAVSRAAELGLVQAPGR